MSCSPEVRAKPGADSTGLRPVVLGANSGQLGKGHPAQALLTPLAIPCSRECDLAFPFGGLSGEGLEKHPDQRTMWSFGPH